MSIRNFLSIFCCLAILVSTPVFGKSRIAMGEDGHGSALVPSNQTVMPIGHVEQIEAARVKDIELSPDGKTLAVLSTNRLLVYPPEGKLIDHLPITAGPLGLAWTPDSQTLFASGDKGQVYHVAETKRGDWTAITSFVVDNLSTNPEAHKSAGAQETEPNCVPIRIRNTC